MIFPTKLEANKMQLLNNWLLIILSTLLTWSGPSARADKVIGLANSMSQPMPGSSVGDLLRNRGYLVEEHETLTQDEYYIGLTRAQNPLLSGSANQSNGTRYECLKRPIVFYHSGFVDAKIFLSDLEASARAKDLVQLDFGATSLAELKRRLADEPTAKSLPLLALNTGHEVWFVHKRGTPRSSRRKQSRPVLELKQLSGKASSSRQQAGGSMNLLFDMVSNALRPILNASQQPLDMLNFKQSNTFDSNRNFWNYSLDEQAAFDVPATIDYVLNLTACQQVGLVSHSTGGALVLMALILDDNLAQKVSKATFWAPTFHCGSRDSNLLYKLLAGPLRMANYVGPFPPNSLTTPMQTLSQQVCSSALVRQTICAASLEFALSLGPNSWQAPYQSESFSTSFYPISSREYIHFVQFMEKHRPSMYDFVDPERNRLAYNSFVPPEYDISSIKTNNMSFWVGAADQLVSPVDALETVDNIKVPFSLNLIDKPNIVFNHVGFFYHEDRANLVIIPTLKEISSL